MMMRAPRDVNRRTAMKINRNCPGSSAKSGLWPRQRPESQFFQRKFAYRPPLRGGTWAPSRGTWAVTFNICIDRGAPDIADAACQCRHPGCGTDGEPDDVHPG